MKGLLNSRTIAFVSVTAGLSLSALLISCGSGSATEAPFDNMQERAITDGLTSPNDSLIKWQAEMGISNSSNPSSAVVVSSGTDLLSSSSAVLPPISSSAAILLSSTGGASSSTGLPLSSSTPTGISSVALPSSSAALLLSSSATLPSSSAALLLSSSAALPSSSAALPSSSAGTGTNITLAGTTAVPLTQGVTYQVSHSCPGQIAFIKGWDATDQGAMSVTINGTTPVTGSNYMATPSPGASFTVNSSKAGTSMKCEG